MLGELPYEVSIDRYENTPFLSLIIGSEFETERIHKYDYMRQIATLHTHPKHGSKFISYQDLSAAEIWQIVSPGLRSFLLTDQGFIEYRVPDNRDDIREIMNNWAKKHNLSNLKPDQDELKRRELIQGGGYIVQEVKWNDPRFSNLPDAFIN
ncbi:MAG: hypothetical protein ABI721_00535 [Candidatus Dojkabacteria bacterium]